MSMGEGSCGFESSAHDTPVGILADGIRVSSTSPRVVHLFLPAHHPWGKAVSTRVGLPASSQVLTLWGGCWASLLPFQKVSSVRSSGLPELLSVERVM